MLALLVTSGRRTNPSSPRRPRPPARALACAAAIVVAFAAGRSRGAEPCQPMVVCAVEVTGLPAVLRSSGGYGLRVGSQAPVALPSSGLAHVAVSERARVRLDGAAYEGHVDVDPADCGGDAVHTLAARARPARLVFHAGDVSARALVVSCLRGCPYRDRPADAFPALPFPRGELEMAVELELKAEGYRPERGEFRLTPGANDIRVTLRRLW